MSSPKDVAAVGFNVSLFEVCWESVRSMSVVCQEFVRSVSVVCQVTKFGELI